jgi:hypothetical protein
MGTLEELVKKISDILSLNEENIRLHKGTFAVPI